MIRMSVSITDDSSGATGSSVGTLMVQERMDGPATAQWNRSA